mmetsp:Transcript_2914/g.3490  ORF Transcript_2914/g.3490 Transcript_2914/m.3490 type:complete len:128 (+) Transcript_2914:2-385(+)
MPTVEPSTLPSVYPSYSPTANHAVVACGSTQCTIDPSTAIVPITSAYGVRCCSENEIQGFVYTGGTCNLWSSSLNEEGECAAHDLSYYDAKAVCEGQGARLCTVEENANNCSKAARCGLNAELVWSQ